MTTSVASVSTENPADLKGPAGSGLAIAEAETNPIILPPVLKQEIQKIISKSAANKVTFTGAEFDRFLQNEQKVSTLIEELISRH